MAKEKSPNVYTQIVVEIFRRHYQTGLREFVFDRPEIKAIANELGLPEPANVGDVLYTFRYRGQLPDSVKATAEPGLQWIIRPVGIGRYKFVQVRPISIVPASNLITIKLPDATPELLPDMRLRMNKHCLPSCVTTACWTFLPG